MLKDHIKIDERELRQMAPIKAIWDYFGISQMDYLALDTNQKLKMIAKYYQKLLLRYFLDSKRLFSALVFCLEVVWNFFVSSLSGIC